MAGILDIFDSPDILGHVLGISPAAAATPPQPPPMPPPQAMQGGTPSFSPTSPMGSMNAMAGGAPMPGGPAPDPFQGVGDPFSGNMTGPQIGVKPMAFADRFDAATPPPNMPAAPGGRGVQLAGGLPANDVEPLPPVNAGGTPAGPGAGMMVREPPMPPRLAPNGAPPTMSGGGLSAALGIPDNRMQQFLAGVGKGASNLHGTGGFANAMRGLGGGVTGAQAKGVEQTQMARQAQNDLFNQSSTAFKDMLAADAAGDNSAYKAAQAQYLKARATALMTGGGAGGSKAWQNTPYGKVIQVESKTQQYEKAQQIVLQKQWTLNGATAEQQKEDLERLNKATEEYRNRLYKAIGVAPDQADKLKNMGTAKDNPFDTKGMTLDEFNQQVPMGAWYKDQNGVPRKRVKPPAGMAPAPGTEANLDDQEAMTPAA